MKKNITLIMLVVLLSGCGIFKTKPPIVITEYKDKYVPVYIIPAPPKTERPSSALTALTEEQKKSLGEVVKAYVIEVNQQDAYIVLLEEVLKKYQELSQKSETNWEIILKDGRAELRQKTP